MVETNGHRGSDSNPSATDAPMRPLPAPRPLRGDALSLRGSIARKIKKDGKAFYNPKPPHMTVPEFRISNCTKVIT